ncbi:MAG TPA: MaoC family dehydratase [Hyphomicrobium sp.]|nr:MaoC family dehydratase [Hyphomicrobium sp.]
MTIETTTKLYLEDLAVGQIFRTRTHTVEPGAIKDFAAEFDPQWFHLDEDAAKDSFFGSLAASGWHTAGITMRLVVETLPLAGGVIGAGGELQWPSPTRPGDILHATIEVLEITPSRSRPERGMGVVRITTRNQRDEVVQTFRVKVLLQRRSSEIA